MRNKVVQVSLLDIYKDVSANLEGNNPKLFQMLDEHIIKKG